MLIVIAIISILAAMAISSFSNAAQDSREIVVRPSYIMVYRIEDEGGTVAVLRVLHAAQQWPPSEYGVDG